MNHLKCWNTWSLSNFYDQVYKIQHMVVDNDIYVNSSYQQIIQKHICKIGRVNVDLIQISVAPRLRGLMSGTCQSSIYFNFFSPVFLLNYNYS